jgi:hypothetical protein
MTPPTAPPTGAAFEAWRGSNPVLVYVYRKEQVTVGPSRQQYGPHIRS